MFDGFPRKLICKLVAGDHEYHVVDGEYSVAITLEEKHRKFVQIYVFNINFQTH